MVWLIVFSSVGIMVSCLSIGWVIKENFSLMKQGHSSSNVIDFYAYKEKRRTTSFQQRKTQTRKKPSM